VTFARPRGGNRAGLGDGVQAGQVPQEDALELLLVVVTRLGEDPVTHGAAGGEGDSRDVAGRGL
jgi:hypothetical protein